MTQTPTSRNLPALRGGFLALGAALLFGASTPLVQRFGFNVSTFWTAALLYAGAAQVGLLSLQSRTQEARLRAGDLTRLAAMAACGAALGPVLLVWGLAHTSGTSASLMLTLEAVFTAVLARWLYAEQMDRRVKGALGLLTAGGVLLVLDQAQAAGDPQWLGLLAVLGATAAWGLDNTLSRSLAERDPGQVVLGKSLLGVLATAGMAFGSGAPFPPRDAVLALLLIGATGYGLSLRLYLLAQREFGAARTGSVFAFAPFIGAVVAYAMGERGASAWLIAGALLMLSGVILHLMERHAHEHRHEPLEHEHAHHHGGSHDDGHHTHVHVAMPAGAHSHPHRHEPLVHMHPHTPDAHHAHHH